MEFTVHQGQAREWRWLSHWGKIASKRFRNRQAVSVALIDSATMRRLNRQWRKKDKATDVLSFALASSRRDSLLGELLICRTVAAKQAKERGHSVERELQILTIHGTLHLLGYDHEKEREAVKMESLERKLLAQLEQVA